MKNNIRKLNVFLTEKKFCVFLILCVLFSFTLCFFSCDLFNQTKPDTPVNYGTKQISIINNSKFDVNIYAGKTNSPRRLDSSVTYTIPAKTTDNYNLLLTSDTDEVFFIVYLIKFGNAVFPYYTNEETSGWKAVDVKSVTIPSLTIDEITNCPTTSAFLLLENNTSSQIELNNGGNVLRPFGKESSYIDANGGSGVYEISTSNDAQISMGLLDQVKIRIDATNRIPLPVINSDITAGNVYTFSVNTKNAGTAAEEKHISLKAVTPFDVDVQNKIWSFDDSTFIANESNFPVLRKAGNLNPGSIVAGTLKKSATTIGIYYLDEYGKNQKPGESGNKGYDIAFNAPNLTEVRVVDFAECSDGCFVFLSTFVYTNSEDDKTFSHVLAKYNCSTKTVSNTYNFEANGISVDWCVDSRNKLFLKDDNTVAIAACINEYDYTSEENQYDDYKYLFGIATFTESSTSFDYYVSTSSDSLLSGLRRQFTSVYYNGNSYIVCGVENWNAEYNTVNHSGVIYSFLPDDLQNPVLLYSNERTIFLSINGIGSKYFATGEYTDTGKILKGFVISSDDLETAQAGNFANIPNSLYVSKRANCFFTQSCIYENKLVLCGTTCLDRAGSQDAMPFVVAMDFDCNILWETTSFTNYSKALNIIPNTIGPYMIQLQTPGLSTVHYVNAGLLGNEE